MKPIRLFLLVLLLFGGTYHNEMVWARDSLSKELTRKIDAIFQDVDHTNTPGCALAISRNGTTIYQRGYGMADLEHHIPITQYSIFYVGSVSKQFVACCILLLEEMGKLRLDDDIRLYLPDFPQYDHPITIRHLLHHTSGIRDYLTLWSLLGRSYLDYMPKDEVYHLICAQKQLNFQPGDEYLYSNSNYFLLAEIVANVSGTSFKEFAQRHIFIPLGMTCSHFHDDNTQLIADRAFGYTLRSDGSWGNLFMRFDLVGSGGLYTCVADLTKWSNNFRHNQLGKKSPDLIKKMLQNGRLNDGKEIPYACALVKGSYRGLKTVQHSGSLAGYRAHFLRFPENDLAIIILGNSASFNPAERAYRIADLLLADQFLEPGPQPVASAPAIAPGSASLPSIKLAEYTGDFYSDELDIIYRLRVKNDTLRLHIRHSGSVPLIPVARDQFRGRFSLHFQRDVDDRIRGFWVNAGRVRHLAFNKVK